MVPQHACALPTQPYSCNCVSGNSDCGSTALGSILRSRYSHYTPFIKRERRPWRALCNESSGADSCRRSPAPWIAPRTEYSLLPSPPPKPLPPLATTKDEELAQPAPAPIAAGGEWFRLGREEVAGETVAYLLLGRLLAPR